MPVAVAIAVGQRQRDRAARHRHDAGAHHLDDAERAHDLDKAVDFVFRAGDFDDERFVRHVHDVSAIDIHQLHRLRATDGIHAHLDQRQVAAHDGRILQVGDLDHVDELVQIRRDALRIGLVAVNHDRHARNAGLLGVADRERFDVERAPPEQGGDSIEHAGLVFDQGYQRMFHVISPIPDR